MITKKKQIKELQTQIAYLKDELIKEQGLREKFRTQAISLEDYIADTGENKTMINKFELISEQNKKLKSENDDLRAGTAELFKMIGGIIAACLNLSTELDHKEINISKASIKRAIEAYKVQLKPTDTDDTIVYDRSET